ncbi:MAG: GxxExxY protein [Bacteroidales bacterium]
MDANKISNLIIGCAISLHRALGPGLLESAYEECLEYELNSIGLIVQRQVPVPIVYKEIKLEMGYRLDMVINNLVVIELKSVDSIMPIHEAQILTYLKFSSKSLGLLINFNVVLLKDGIRRYIMTKK